MGSRFLAVAALAVLSALGVQAAPAPQQCQIRNVCYIIDQSGAISEAEYVSEQSFVKRVADAIQTESSVTPFNSAVAFASFALTIQSPTNDINTFKNAVDSQRTIRGTTSISSGLNQCKNELNNAQGKKAMVLITDGHANSGDINPARQAASGATAAGINIITVGIGYGVSTDFLKEIASNASLFIDANFDDLDQKVPDVVEAVCGPNPPTKCEKAFNDCLTNTALRMHLTKITLKLLVFPIHRGQINVDF
ncbi:unnamed protein product [Agarophyton chilense]